MNVSGILEKLNKIPGKLKELSKAIIAGIPALFTRQPSLSDIVKDKREHGKNPPEPFAGSENGGSPQEDWDIDSLLLDEDSSTGKVAFDGGAGNESSGARRLPYAKLAASLSAKINYFSDHFLSGFPENKRKPILFMLGGLLVLFVVLLISTLVLHTGKSKNGDTSERLAGIPHEELFYPDEPNFIPDFLLEREPRRFWTAEDIQPYWRNPAYSEFWQEEIKTGVDKLMEGVP